MQVLILGFHRSNTSLIANWLSENGLFLGEDLLSPSKHNMNGYYEDTEFLSINLDILNDNEMDRSAIFKCINPVIKKERMEAVKQIVNRRDSKYLNWGFKDPRTTLLVRGLYLKVLNDPYFIIIYRDYKNVVSSIMKREFGVTSKMRLLNLTGGLKKNILYYFYYPNKVLLAWLHYNNELIRILNESYDNNYCLIKTENLMNDERFISKKLKSKNLINGDIMIKSIFDSTLIPTLPVSFILNPILVIRAKKILRRLNYYYNLQLPL